MLKNSNHPMMLSPRDTNKTKLEAYVASVESTVTDPVLSAKLKKSAKDKIEAALSDALQTLEIEESSADDYRKAELALKRAVTKVWLPVK